MLRTVNDQSTLWDAILPPELLVLPVELGRVDALLDDPAFFAPFAAHFDARIGRPSIPMETYLRLMFLKFRYRLGYESLCREVADSISWQRFCRIPFGTRVPHPTTLMKITTRCGDDAVAGLNEALLAKAAAAKLLRTDKVRADTTVVEADVAYPTDSGLLAKAIGKIARTVERMKAAGGATRTRSRDRRRAAGRRARSIAAKLRLRGHSIATRPRPRCVGSPANWPGSPNKRCATPTAVIRNARRALRRAAGQRRGRLRRAINDLHSIVGRTERVVAQTRSRLAGVMPDRATGLSACMMSMLVRSAKDAWASRSSSATRPRSWTTPTGSSSITTSRSGIRPMPRSWSRRSNGSRLAPDARRAPLLPTGATVKPAVERDLHELGVRRVAIPRKSKPSAARREFEHRRAFREKVKWRTGSEGRINHIKRSYGWNRTELTSIHGARTWCGHGVFAHNLVKIGALAA